MCFRGALFNSYEFTKIHYPPVTIDRDWEVDRSYVSMHCADFCVRTLPITEEEEKGDQAKQVEDMKKSNYRQWELS